MSNSETKGDKSSPERGEMGEQRKRKGKRKRLNEWNTPVVKLKLQTAACAGSAVRQHTSCSQKVVVGSGYLFGRKL